MLNEQVRTIMTKNPIVVHPDDIVRDVSEMMVTKRIQQLPVVEDKKLVGIITSYDLWRDLRESTNSEDKTVREVMKTNVAKIAPKDHVKTAAELFIDRRFKTLPVVNLRNELKGVVTSFDFIKYVIKKDYPNPILYRDVILGE
ncbi:MAG: CBS domain-containing protein [Saprospiraceae bacterium]|jgi:CBS domain-containing protein